MEDFRVIADMPCFSRAAMLADATQGHSQLELYAWEGRLYSDVDVEDLASRVWHRIFAVDDIDLSYDGSVHTKRVQKVNDVAKGMMSLAGGRLMEENVDVDIWRYWHFGERPHVAKFMFLFGRDVGRYAVDGDAICWHPTITPARFRYEDRSESTYWTPQVK